MISKFQNTVCTYLDHSGKEFHVLQTCIHSLSLVCKDVHHFKLRGDFSEVYEGYFSTLSRPRGLLPLNSKFF